MFKSTPFSAGDLLGNVFIYENVGDTLADHAHGEMDNHITIVMDGSFRCTGNKLIEGKILKPGQVALWPVGERHGFVALEPNSRMLQINTTARQS